MQRELAEAESPRSFLFVHDREVHVAEAGDAETRILLLFHRLLVLLLVRRLRRTGRRRR